MYTSILQALYDKSNTKKEKDSKTGNKCRRKRIILHDSSSDEDTTVNMKKMKNTEDMPQQKPTAVLDSLLKAQDVVHKIKHETNSAMQTSIESTTKNPKSIDSGNKVTTEASVSSDNSTDSESSKLLLNQSKLTINNKVNSISGYDPSVPQSSSQLSLHERTVGRVKPMPRHCSDSDLSKQYNSEGRLKSNIQRSLKLESLDPLEQSSKSFGSTDMMKKEEHVRPKTALSLRKPSSSTVATVGLRPVPSVLSSSLRTVPQATTSLTHASSREEGGVVSAESIPSASVAKSAKQVNYYL